MKGKVLLISIFMQMFAPGSALYAADDNRAAIVSYIHQYEEIAVSEMHRTGIPASIKLAQAVLESNAGRSHLAVTANNHFGIKCGSSWKGKKAWRKDDDYDSNGKLRHSCFRAYEHAEASFIAHSDFLSDPNKAHRYGFLFEIDKTDYKSWAHGLKKAGYATNPKYANLLIRIIDSYDLHRYDLMDPVPDPGEMIAREEVAGDAPAEDKETRQVFFMIQGGDTYEIHERNKVEYILVDEGDTPEVIALEMGIGLEELLEYNDHIYRADEELEAGSAIYLERKKNRFKYEKEFHPVQEGETMEEIAQKYGIKLHKLYKRNRMKEGTQPGVGEKVVLKGRRPKNSAVRLRQSPLLRPDKDPVSPAREVPSPSSKDTLHLDDALIRRDKANAAAPLPSQIRIHVVNKGETLYAISRRYGVPVEKLMELNDIKDYLIVPGQELKLE